MTCGPCQCCAEIRAELATMRALLERIAPPCVPEPKPEQVPPLVQALADAFGPSVFTSREAWQRAMEVPALWAAMQDVGISGTHHLGHWLGDHKGAGIESPGVERDGTVWHCDLTRFGQTT